MPLDKSLLGKQTEPATFLYTWKDAVLYALGVGAKSAELDYLFEGRGPKVLPTFAVVPKLAPMFDLLTGSGGDLSMIVHGSERVVVHAPLPPAGSLRTRASIQGLYDLRRMALVQIATKTEDAGGRLLAETTSAIVFRGQGGFGGEPPRKERPAVERPEGQPPTFSIEEATSPEQALLYRLSGDLNPLHADPDFARRVGFDRGPILHGLCTMGFLARHVARGACGGDATRIRALEAQFKRPVFPGETLVTDGWRVGSDGVALQVRVKERDEVVIAGAWAALGE